MPAITPVVQVCTLINTSQLAGCKCDCQLKMSENVFSVRGHTLAAGKMVQLLEAHLLLQVSA